MILKEPIQAFSSRNKGSMLKYFNFFFMLVILNSCAGYKSTLRDNPFKKYNIKSISIPLFVNKSIFSNLNALSTQRVSEVLLTYSKLKISFGENYSADAFLIGVVSSKKNIKSVFTSSGNKFTDGNLQNSIGKRKSFYIPTLSSYSYSVTFYLIKHPLKSDLKFLKNKLPNMIKKKHPKVIFVKTITTTASFEHPLKYSDLNDSGVVNFTQAQGNYNDSLIKSTYSMAKQFKQMVNNETF